MFLDDTSNQATLRQQQMQQYAEELRQQIAAKQTKPKSPSPWSTTTADSFSGTQTLSNSGNQSSNINQQNWGPPAQNFNNSNRRNQPNQSRNRPISDLRPAPLAPLTISLGTRRTENAPLYARSTFQGINTDIGSFPSRLDNIDRSLSDTYSGLSSMEQVFDGFSSEYIPTMNQSIQKLRSMIESISASDIPNETKNIKKNLNETRNSLTNTISKFNGDIQNLRQSFMDTTARVSSFQGHFNEINETSKSQLKTLSMESTRVHSANEQLNTAIISAADRLQKITNNISEQNSLYGDIDEGITETFSQIQNQIIDLVKQITEQLVEEIKIESENRASSGDQLQKQVEEVNQRATSNSQRLSQLLSQLQESFKAGFAGFQQSFSLSIEKLHNENEALLAGEEEIFENLVLSSENNFATIQSEMISTMDAVKVNWKQTTSELYDALETEKSTNKKNMKEIKEKLQNFDKLILSEIELQKQQFKDTIAESEERTKDYIDKTAEPLLNEVRAVRSQNDVIEQTEAKMVVLEDNLKVVNQMLTDTISQINKDFNQLHSEFVATCNKIDDGFSVLESRSQILEDPMMGSGFALRPEIMSQSRDADDRYNEKIIEVEKMLDMIFKNLGLLQMTEFQQNLSATDGSKLISELLNQEGEPKEIEPVSIHEEEENEFITQPPVQIETPLKELEQAKVLDEPVVEEKKEIKNDNKIKKDEEATTSEVAKMALSNNKIKSEANFHTTMKIKSNNETHSASRISMMEQLGGSQIRLIRPPTDLTQFAMSDGEELDDYQYHTRGDDDYLPQIDDEDTMYITMGPAAIKNNIETNQSEIVHDLNAEQNKGSLKFNPDDFKIEMDLGKPKQTNLQNSEGQTEEVSPTRNKSKKIVTNEPEENSEESNSIEINEEPKPTENNDDSKESQDQDEVSEKEEDVQFYYHNYHAKDEEHKEGNDDESNKGEEENEEKSIEEETQNEDQSEETASEEKSTDSPHDIVKITFGETKEEKNKTPHLSVRTPKEESENDKEEEEEDKDDDSEEQKQEEEDEEEDQNENEEEEEEDQQEEEDAENEGDDEQEEDNNEEEENDEGEEDDDEGDDEPEEDDNDEPEEDENEEPEEDNEDDDGDEPDDEDDG